MHNKIADCYIRRVSRRIPVGGNQKRQFLSVLKDNAIQRMYENPATTASQLEADLGSPDDIAADFISQMSFKEINNKFRARNRIVAAVIIAALLIVGIWGIAISVALDNVNSKSDGYIGSEEITTSQEVS